MPSHSILSKTTLQNGSGDGHYMVPVEVFSHEKPFKPRKLETVSVSSNNSLSSPSTNDLFAERHFQLMTSSSPESNCRRPSSFSRTQTEKLQSIMKFLDEENRVSLSDDAKDKLQKKTNWKTCMANLGLSLMAPLNSSTRENADVTNISPVTNFLDDQEALILSLRLQLNRESEKMQQVTHLTEETTKRRLKQQKDIYQSKLRHLQSQISQLVDEKTILTDRCDTLASDLKQHIVKSEQKLTNQERRNQETFKNAKIQWDLAEKGRRQKWISQRADQIKEDTLKSVEPEIQHVLDRHKHQINVMQTHFEQMIQQSNAQADHNYCQKISQTEESFLQRMEDVRRQERHLAEQILADKLAETEKNFRLELDRKEEECKISKKTCDERFRLQSEEISYTRRHSEEQRQKIILEEHQRAHDEKNELEWSHKKEIKKTQMETEEHLSAWKKEFQNLQEDVYKQKLEKEKKKMKEERNVEVTKIIAAMSDQLATLQTNLEKTSDVRVTRIQELCQQECNQLNSAVEMWKEACQGAKDQTRLWEGQNESQKCRQEDLERRLSEALQDCERLEKERLTVAEDIREQYSGRFQDLELLIEKLKKEVLESERKYTMDTFSLRDQNEAMKRQNELALETVSEKVHALVEKKDARIEMLRQELVQFHQTRYKNGICKTLKGSRVKSAQVLKMSSLLRKKSSAFT